MPDIIANKTNWNLTNGVVAYTDTGGGTSGSVSASESDIAYIHTTTALTPKLSGIEPLGITLYLTKHDNRGATVKYQYVLEYIPSASGAVKAQDGSPSDLEIPGFFDLYLVDSIRDSFRLDSNDNFTGSGDRKEYKITSSGFNLRDVKKKSTVFSGTIEIKKDLRAREVTFVAYAEFGGVRINNVYNTYGAIRTSKAITIEKATATTPDEDEDGGSGTTSSGGGDTTTTSTDEVPLWTADWSTAKIFELDANSPTTAPPKPTAKIEHSSNGGNPTLVVEMDKSDIFDSRYKVGLMFDIVQDDVTHLYSCDDVVVFSDEDLIITDVCTVRLEVYNGSRYNVRCRTIKYVDKEVYTSEWSEWSDTVEAAPLAPEKITVCRAASSNGTNIDSIYLEWKPSATAKSYEIQYSTNRDLDSLEDSDTFKSVKTGDDGTKYTFKVADSGTQGGEYFLRIRALGDSDSIKSAWSPIVSVTLGSNPAAPTTWSSASTITAGEPINLYWVHNTTDGSSETYAVLTITLDGKPYPVDPIYKPNPTMFIVGMQVYLDKFYTYGNSLYQCIKAGTPTDITDTAYFKKIKDYYDPDETSYYTLDTSSQSFKEGVVVKWSVVTYGVDLSKPSLPSTTREINVYAKPTVALSVTDNQGNIFDTLTALPIRVKATTKPVSQQPIGYYLSVKANDSYTTRDAIGNPKVVHKDDLVYYKYFDINTPLDTALSAGDITLENNVSYTMTCIASMNSGLTAEHSVLFSVGWSVEQHLPTAAVVVNTNTYAAAIRPYCEEIVPYWYTVNKGEDGLYTVGSRVDEEVSGLIPLVKSAEPIGKNMLDVATIIETNNCEATSLNGVLTITKTSEGVTYASLTPMYLTGGKTYVLSYKTSDPNSKHYWCDADDDAVVAQVSAKTFTPVESGYYRIDFHNDGDIASIVTIRNAQVEVGETATFYEEYQGTDVIMEKTTTGVEIYTTASGEEFYCNLFEKKLVEDIVLSIYRRDHDGGFTEIAKDIPNANVYVPDPHPALDYARYRIVATSTRTGYVSYYDLPNQPVGGKSVIIQWDEEWNDYDADKGRTTEKTWTGSLLSIPYNIDVSDKRAVDVEMIKYVGRKHPVSYYGTHLGEVASWSCAVPKSDKETLYALRRLAAWAGDVYVREPSGVGYWANVVVSFSQKHRDLIVPVSFEITRVEGGV